MRTPSGEPVKHHQGDMAGLARMDPASELALSEGMDLKKLTDSEC